MNMRLERSIQHHRQFLRDWLTPALDRLVSVFTIIDVPIFMLFDGHTLDEAADA